MIQFIFSCQIIHIIMAYNVQSVCVISYKPWKDVVVGGYYMSWV